eukprot:5630079-Amphidinium_carterae.1
METSPIVGMFSRQVLVLINLVQSSVTEVELACEPDLRLLPCWGLGKTDNPSYGGSAYELSDSLYALQQCRTILHGTCVGQVFQRHQHAESQTPTTMSQSARMRLPMSMIFSNLPSTIHAHAQ